MRELYLSNIDYSNARLLARKYSQRLNQVGCGIYINAAHDKMIIKWRASLPTVISRILDFIDYAFCDDTAYDTLSILKLKRAIAKLEDNHAVIFNYSNGEFEIIEL